MTSTIKVDTISEKTSANGVAIDSVTLKDGGIAATAASTITVSDNTDNLTLTSTDADANAGPNLRLYRNSSSPADDDRGGVIEFEGRNDNSQDVVYSRIETFQSDVSDGTEDAAFTIETMLNGTLRERMGMGIVATVFNDDSQDIDFRVESNGQTHMIHVDAGSDHVNIAGGGTDGGGVLNVFSADNTTTLSLVGTDADANQGPILDFYRNSSSPADNDGIGQINFTGRNDNSQDVVYGQLLVSAQDVSDGTEDAVISINSMKAGELKAMVGLSATEIVLNNESADIDFRVESNDNTHMIFVNAANNEVGIGESAPSKTLQVQSETSHSNYVLGLEASSSSAPYGIGIDYLNASPDNNDYWFINGADSTTSRFRVTSQGDVLNHDNSYGSISDERIKQDIVDSSSQWDDIKALKIRNYKKKDDVRQHADKAPLEIGVIAQELETAGMSGLVSENPPTPADVASDSSFGTLYEDGDDIPRQYKVGDVKEAKTTVKSVKYSVLYMKAIKALQEAMAKIETLEADVKTLKGE